MEQMSFAALCRSGDRRMALLISLRQAGIVSNAPVWLIVILIVCAILLGGGGSPSPAMEMMLQLVFIFVAVGWVWTRGRTSYDGADLSLLPGLLIASILAIPVLQLIPLPPSLWSSLPGREDQVAALALIGEEHSWRPLSLSPHRTIASLLAIVPAVFCIYAAARLSWAERRLVLAAIAGMTIVSVVLGVLQLASGNVALSFYSHLHTGWVTGFQANRNAAADVLLIGLLALSALAAPHLAQGLRSPPGHRRAARSQALIVGGLSLLILFAAAMTGSRAGILLIPLAVAAACLIYCLAPGPQMFRHWRALVAGLAAILAIAILAVVALSLSQETALGRVIGRFGNMHSDARPEIWQDSWLAMTRYWPAGFGMGGFEPAMLAAERLEFLDVTRPNRAHSDYLEFALESGVAGLLAILACAGLILAMALRAWRTAPEMRHHVVFSLTCLLVIALHSIVDYPLRSMSLACLAGFAAGSLAIPRNQKAEAEVREKPTYSWGRV